MTAPELIESLFVSSPDSGKFINAAHEKVIRKHVFFALIEAKLPVRPHNEVIQKQRFRLQFIK